MAGVKERDDAVVLNLGTPSLVNLNTWSMEYLIQFFELLDVVLFDCDGVIWSGTETFPKAKELIQKLRSMGIRIFFVTNDSTKPREALLTKFIDFGFKVYPEEILCPTYLAALYLQEKNFSRKAYVIGHESIRAELLGFGIESLPVGPDHIHEGGLAWHQERQNFEKDPDVGAVIVAFDIFFSYKKLFKAAAYLTDPNVHFLATNTDDIYPYGNLILPDTGPIVSAIQTASQREPIVVGKPGTLIFDHLRKSYNVEPSKTLIIGDKASTDILFGRNSNLWTLLVLSGITQLDQVREWAETGTDEQKRQIPHFYLEDIAEFYALLCQACSDSRVHQLQIS